MSDTIDKQGVEARNKVILDSWLKVYEFLGCRFLIKTGFFIFKIL